MTRGRGAVGANAGVGGPSRVWLIDDHPLFAVGLRHLLDRVEDLQWVGAGPSVATFLRRRVEVDVVVLDLRLEDGSTPYDNVRQLCDAGLKVLVYTSGEHPELLRSAAGAGALGVVLKSESPQVVLEAVRSVARGKPVTCTQWAAALDADPDLAAVNLSPQLQRVLTRYASGETASTIARGLGIATDTVNDYIREIRLRYAEAGRPTPTKQDFYKRALEDGWLPYPRRRRSPR